MEEKKGHKGRMREHRAREKRTSDFFFIFKKIAKFTM